MTQEEKAQRYDKAIKIAKDSFNYPSYPGFIRADVVFPELKESEDERIRKAVVDAVMTLSNSPLKTKMLSWLEKQGELKSTQPIWKYKKDNTPLLRDSLILNKYGCVAKSPSGALVSDVWVLDYDELSKLPKEEYEKQGEKKPTDKVEPKFKVGDIIRHKKQGFTCKITAVDTEYRVSDCCGTHLPFDSQADYELVEQKPVDEYIEVKGLSEIESEVSGLTKELSGETHNLTDFERTLADICIGWIGDEPGWEQYIKDNADVLLKIAINKINSAQDTSSEHNSAWKPSDAQMERLKE